MYSTLLDAYIKFHQVKVAILIKVWSVLIWLIYGVLCKFHTRDVVAKKDFDDIEIHITYASADSKVVTNWLAASCRLHGSLCMDALLPLGTKHLIRYMHDDAAYSVLIDLKTKKINDTDILFDLIML